MRRQQFDSQSLATFRMRCWHELADMDHPHYIQDYMQLADDARRMHVAITQRLCRDFPAHQPLDATRAEAEAELLVTVLLADHYATTCSCQPSDPSQPSDLRQRAYALLPHLRDKRLLCHLLVLLLFTDSHSSPALQSQASPTFQPHSASTLQSQILPLLPTLEQQNPEDRHIQNLYHATVEV